MRGSMTIEAVFVITLLLVIIMWIMSAAISLHGQAIETSRIEWIRAEETAEAFRRNSFLKGFLE